MTIEIIGAGAAGVIAGAVGALATEGLRRPGSGHEGPKFPEHWPAQAEYLAPDTTGRLFVTMSAKEAQRVGGMIPLGRTLPGFNPIPDLYGFRELRRRWTEATTKPIFMSKTRRLQHTAIIGPTGKGKSTQFMFQFLAWDATNECSNIVIDVKSPELFNMFYQPYLDHGKKVLFFDPWCPTDTLAYEPLYRADSQSLDRLCSVIMSYSPTKGEQGGGKNDQFFEDQAEKLLRGLMELAQSWPRQFCNLPCIQQLVSAGGDSILEAFKYARESRQTLDDVMKAARIIIEASDEAIAGSRDPLTRGEGRSAAISNALVVLDRSGYPVLNAVRLVRGEWNRYSEDERARKMTAFEGLITRTLAERDQRLERALTNLGDFFGGADDTRNSIIPTLANKVKPFANPLIAAAFSRDELDLDDLIKSQTLLIVGTPLAEMKTGAGFVSSIFANSTIKVIEGRRVRQQAGERGIKDHPIYSFFDEFPQLGIKGASQALATHRGFNSGWVIIYQDRSQLVGSYGDEAKNIEANTLTYVALGDTHPETAQYIAETILGKVAVKKKSKSKSSGQAGSTSVSESVEHMNLMSSADVRQMRVNGKVWAEAALHLGSPVPFLFLPTFFWNDMFTRGLLRMRRVDDTRPALMKRVERWEPAVRTDPYITRRPRVRHEVRDSLSMTADFLTGYRPTELDALDAPTLDLRAVGSAPVDPAAILDKKRAQGQPAPAPEPDGMSLMLGVGPGGLSMAPVPQAPPRMPAAVPGAVPVPGPSAPPMSGPTNVAIPSEKVLPRYSEDQRILIHGDMEMPDYVVSPGNVPGRSFSDRVEALEDIAVADQLEPDDAPSDPNEEAE